MYSLEHKTYMLVPVNLNPLVLHNDKLVKRITAPDRPTYVAMWWSTVGSPRYNGSYWDIWIFLLLVHFVIKLDLSPTIWLTIHFRSSSQHLYISLPHHIISSLAHWPFLLLLRHSVTCSSYHIAVFLVQLKLHSEPMVQLMHLYKLPGLLKFMAVKRPF